VQPPRFFFIFCSPWPPHGRVVGFIIARARRSSSPRATVGASEIGGSFVVAGSRQSDDNASAKLHFLFLHACEEGDAEQVHTLISMFGGKDLDVNVRKTIAGTEEEGLEDEQEEGGEQGRTTSSLGRGRKFNTFPMTLQVNAFTQTPRR